MFILQIQKLTKRFSGLVALDSVDMDVEEGTIHALIGPNGAGKTTLFNVLSGFNAPTSGNITFLGEPIAGLPAYTICRKGIARTFQNIRLFKNMSVLGNVMTACHVLTRSEVLHALLRLRHTRREEEWIREQAMAALAYVGLAHRQNDVARSLPYGQQRLLELARALVTKPRLILLDEPTAGMNAGEISHLSDIILDLKAKGITVLLVEHNVRVVMSISDRITVLNYGIKIAEGRPSEIQDDPNVIEAYLGRQAADA